jgi:hypothetical protein
VLYQSSEDSDLRYKSYQEDVLWGLRLAGALLIPRLEYCRAHHDKVFMEFLRDLSRLPEIQTVRSRAFGTLEDAKAALDHLEVPCVVKGASSACSEQVALAKDHRELLRHVERFSRSDPMWRQLRRVIAGRICRWLGRQRSPRVSLHRNRLVVQPFVAGLQHDYKVLVYGDRYYAVRRRVRTGDFRASGSGMVEWPGELPAGLLDYAKKISDHFGAPFVSLDIAQDERGFHLLEFQFVLFGNLTVEGAEHWFVSGPRGWERKVGRSVIEAEFARSVDSYLRGKSTGDGVRPLVSGRGPDRASR